MSLGDAVMEDGLVLMPLLVFVAGLVLVCLVVAYIYMGFKWTKENEQQDKFLSHLRYFNAALMESTSGSDETEEIQSKEVRKMWHKNKVDYETRELKLLSMLRDILNHKEKSD
jgi:Ca2+/Na+ antiporter